MSINSRLFMRFRYCSLAKPLLRTSAFWFVILIYGVQIKLTSCSPWLSGEQSKRASCDHV